MLAVQPEDEQVMEVDADNRVLGERPKSDFYRSGLIHRAVHLLIFNTEGELLIQRRSSRVLLYPSLFDFSCSGCVRLGESYRDALQRELKEELGIAAAFTELFDFEFNDHIDYAFHRVYATVHDGPFTLDNAEVSDVHWVDLDLLQDDLFNHSARFAPQFKNALRIFFRDFRKRHAFGTANLPELVTFKRGRKNLQGELFTQDNKRAVILLHGLMEDRHSAGRFDWLSVELHHAGFDVLRFDFSGCGESDSDEITIAREVEDLGAAVSFMKERGYETLGIVGYSLGGLIALHARDPSVKTFVLWAPVTAPATNYLGRFDEQTQQSLLKRGKAVIERHGRKYRLSMNFIQEREAIDQERLCTLSRPVLIIHGDQDERVPLQDSRAATSYFSAARLVPMPGAHHNLFERFDDTLELTLAWLDDHLRT